jgi:trimeric autotransporter adhesin
MRISSGGDISFYEDTGTTAKLFWDASAESLGIGTTSPAAKLHIETQPSGAGITPSGNGDELVLENNSNCGLTIGTENLGSILFGKAADNDIGGIGYNMSDNSMRFTTNTVERLRIGSSGNVGIGTSSPSAKLAVVGTTKVGEGVASNTSKLMVNTLSGTAAGIQLFQDGVESWIIQNPASTTALTFGNSGSERMRIDANGNIIIAAGSGTLQTATAGTSNFRAGVNAGNSIISGGNYNVLVGDEAGTAITTGDYNTAVGYYAGGSVTTGINNTLVGGLSGDAITTGQYNTLYGYRSGTAITDAEYNVGLGGDALFTNTTGDNNTAVGQAALYSNTTASNNTAVGRSALVANTTGASNVAVGALALDANTTAANNTAVGYASLGGNTTGAFNTALGRQALLLNTTADDNTAVGGNALFQNTTGASNVAVGAYALDANTTASNNTAVGHASLGANTTGADNVAVGHNALTANTTADNNTAVGHNALTANTTGHSNTAFGKSALSDNTTGIENHASGFAALDTSSTGSYNTAVGARALQLATTASNNTAVGNSALKANTTGTKNVCIGFGAGDAITTGSNNTIIGDFAGTTTLADTIVLASGTTERLRIDSSGNLLVGTTSVNPGLGNTNEGHSLNASGAAVHSADGNNALRVNRNTSDGTVITIAKDGTSVGSIGVIHGNNLFIGAPSHSGLQFGSSIVYPTGGSTGDANDATVDIGASGQRFKDLYLSGGVVFNVAGGTGTSTSGTLDDYEEGTFTPTWTPASGSGQTITAASGWYTKTGNRVFVDIYLATNGHGTASGNLTLGGLPFTQTTNSNQNASLSCGQAANAVLVAGQSGAARVNQAATNITPLVWDATTGTTTMTVSQWGVSGTWRFTGSYQV